jgi:transcriptional regulator with XRE-family HTH domain
MSEFGKRLKDIREQKGLSQSKLSNMVDLHHSIIGRYERSEAKPTSDVIVKLAQALDTTASYLLGEVNSPVIFKNPQMLERFKDILGFSENDQEHIIYTLDAMINNVKFKAISGK